MQQEFKGHITKVRTGLRQKTACPTWTLNVHTVWLDKNKNGLPVKHTLGCNIKGLIL